MLDYTEKGSGSYSAITRADHFREKFYGEIYELVETLPGSPGRLLLFLTRLPQGVTIIEHRRGNQRKNILKLDTLLPKKYT